MFSAIETNTLHSGRDGLRRWSFSFVTSMTREVKEVESPYFNLEKITYCKTLYISCTTKEGRSGKFFRVYRKSLTSLISSSLSTELSILKQTFQKPIHFIILIAVLTGQAADTLMREKTQLKWSKMHPTAGGLKNANRP